MLISLIIFHDASAGTSTAQKQFDPEESDNEDELSSSSNNPMITEEGVQKQFNTEDEVDPPSDDLRIMKQKQFDPEESDNKD